MRSCVALPFLILGALVPACSTSPLYPDDSGYHCDSAYRCAAGYVCDPGAFTCIAVESCPLIGPDGLCQRCGDGVATGTEPCDTAGESATCNSDCTSPRCGDDKVNANAGEECDDGVANSDTVADACRASSCAAPSCGDGVTDTGEACDDGNDAEDDGCSPACVPEPGYACRGQPSHCWQPLVSSVTLSPGGSVLGEVVVDFAEPVVLQAGSAVPAAHLFTVETTDRFGNRVPLPVTGVRYARRDGLGCNIDAGAAPGDVPCERAIVSVGLSQWDCATAPQRFHYGSDYGVRVSSSFAAADGSPTANVDSDTEWLVRTSAAPRLLSASATNGITDCDLLAGTCTRALAEGPRVPIDASITVRFAEAMHAASFVASNPPDAARDTVLLRQLARPGRAGRGEAGEDPECLVPLVLSMSSSQRLHVRADPTATASSCGIVIDGASYLRFDRELELIVRGRDAGVAGVHDCGPNTDGFREVCASDGRYLERDLVIPFTTSSSNDVATAPAIACNGALEARFSRPLATASVKPTALKVTTSGGTELSSAVALDAADATLLTATLAAAACPPPGQAVIATPSAALRDTLGNPLPSYGRAVTLTAAVTQAPQVDEITPAQQSGDPDGSCSVPGAFIPPTAAPSSALMQQVSGHRGVTVRLQPGHASRPLLASTHAGLILEDITAGAPVAVPASVVAAFAADAPTGSDRLFVMPERYLRAGRLYRFYITEALGNVAGQAATCTTFAAKVPVFLRGEACPPGGACAPSLVSATPSPGAADVPSTTAITLHFSEAIDPASFVDTATGAGRATVRLIGPDGQEVPVTLSFAGTRWYDNAATVTTATALAGARGYGFDTVLVQPDAPLEAGTHKVVLADVGDAANAGAPCSDPTTAPLGWDALPAAVTDAAGNCLRPVADWTFAVEQTPPFVTSLAPSSSPSPGVALSFSEPVAADAILQPGACTFSSSLACFDALQRGACVRLGGGANDAAQRECTREGTCTEAVIWPALPGGLFELTASSGLSTPWSLILSGVQVTDLAGNAYDPQPVDPAAVQFDGVDNLVAGASAAPVLICSSPAHDPEGAHPVTASTPLLLTFSRPVRWTTLATLRIENACDGSTVDPGTGVTVDPEQDGTSFSLLPRAGAWPREAVLAVTVGTGVIGTDGGALGSVAQIRFKVGSPGRCPY